MGLVKTWAGYTFDDIDPKLIDLAEQNRLKAKRDRIIPIFAKTKIKDMDNKGKLSILFSHPIMVP
jgi:hypothetical protein